MDGARRDATRLDEPAADDADGPGDLRRALDELTAADDDDRVRRVIDALIHPRPAAASGGAAAAAPDPSTPVSGAAAPVRGAGDLKAAPDDLGLCPVDTRRRLLDVEHANAARYGARTTVVLMEISDAGAVEAALG